LSLISAARPQDNHDCRMLGVNDMRPSERAQVIAGLPSGTLDDAISQIEELARSSVLPICATPTPTPTPTSIVATSAPLPPPPPETFGENGVPRAPGETPAPETPTTVTAPAPAPPDGPPPGAPPVSPAPPPPSTVTALPPPPPQPGTNCREVR
jgi:protein phosphatase